MLSDKRRKVGGTWEIADYLDKAYPELPALMGCPNARALARFMGSRADNVLIPNLMRVVLPDFLQRLHVKDREYYRESREAWFASEQPVLAEDDPLQSWLACMQDRFEGLPRSLPAAA